MNAAIRDFNAASVGHRQLHARKPDAIVADLNACAAVLSRELAAWRTTLPTSAGLTSAETSVQGLRNLVGQLRIALEDKPPEAA
jgi:hypothetical protein